MLTSRSVVFSQVLRVWMSALKAMLLCLSMVAAVEAAEPTLEATVVYVGREEAARVPLSLLDVPIEDEGWRGAQLGINDNQTTGRFLGHGYELEQVVAGEDESVVEAVKPRIRDGKALIVSDLVADDLIALARGYPDALIINVRAQDDRLRNEDCQSNVLHIAPSRAMLTDALAQYLSWKRWRDLVLVTGRHPEDALFASAMERAAKRYGLKWAERKDWTAIPGARRTDSGHHNLQQEVPVFTRFKEHDVVVVADEYDEFGEYFSYRMSEPRPVAGTQGLIPTAWHRSQEQWGATQIQRRFIKLADRFMTARDYGAWAAVRSIGEGITKTSSIDAGDIRHYLLSEKFNLAGFKGVPLTFRTWNGQLRQPVLIAAPRMLVSVSPQDGFLHQVTELDTLGYDQPESRCGEF